jgi:DNA-binding transcriptional LysR family regulator
VHWLLLPRLAALQNSLQDINLRLQNLRTAEVISRLQESSLDFGLVRRDALTDPLAAFLIGKMEYALFCPKALVRSADPPSPRQLLATIPLAMQSGAGAFMRQFRNWAEENSLDVSIKLECDSFPQACRSLGSGEFVAILPTIARCDLPKEAYLELPLPFLNKRPRQLCLAWNPRTLRLRSEAVRVCDVLRAALKLK